MQVLLVEDDEPLAFMVKKRLEALDSVEVVCVKTTKAAIDWLLTAKPDVVLLDLNLPDSYGMATFDSVVAYAEGTPIVIASASGDRDAPRQAIQRGAYDYIEKGKFDPVEVYTRLESAVVAHSKEIKNKTKTTKTIEEASNNLKNKACVIENVKTIASCFQRMAETDAS